MLSSVAILISLALIGLVLIAIILTNRLQKPDYGAADLSGEGHDLPPADTTLRVLTWNIGYASLGKDADFVIDQGRSFRALSKPHIAKAAGRIAATLGQGDCDVICVQELAEPSFLTRHVNVRAIVDKALQNTQNVFWVDLKTLFFPRFLRFRHGMATYARRQFRFDGVLPFPKGYSLFGGFIRKSYVGLITRLRVGDTGRDWVVINLHLPVFHTTDAARATQVRHLFDLAQKEHAKGNYVVLAGDWNMRLLDTTFKNQTDTRHLDWQSDFPHHLVPDGWHVAVDPKTPTVRALHEPYRVGQTYTTIIDGVITSPNVQVQAVRTHDLGFADSDHHPVEVSLHTI